MSPGMETSRENLTLTDAELAACKPLAGEGGHRARIEPARQEDAHRHIAAQTKTDCILE